MYHTKSVHRLRPWDAAASVFTPETLRARQRSSIKKLHIPLRYLQGRSVLSPHTFCFLAFSFHSPPPHPSSSPSLSWQPCSPENQALSIQDNLVNSVIDREGRDEWSELSRTKDKKRGRCIAIEAQYTQDWGDQSSPPSVVIELTHLPCKDIRVLIKQPSCPTIFGLLCSRRTE